MRYVSCSHGPTLVEVNGTSLIKVFKLTKSWEQKASKFYWHILCTTGAGNRYKVWVVVVIVTASRNKPMLGASVQHSKRSACMQKSRGHCFCKVGSDGTFCFLEEKAGDVKDLYLLTCSSHCGTLWSEHSSCFEGSYVTNCLIFFGSREHIFRKHLYLL